mgnify:CR=1 FL=1|jgi:DNA-binding Lrp family transcriptional regulator
MKGVKMTTAIILINVKRSKLNTVSRSIKDIKGITEVYTVAGEYDLVAMLRIKDITTFQAILTEQMTHIEGVTRTKTLIALDVISDIDMKKVFNVM